MTNLENTFSEAVSAFLKGYEPDLTYADAIAVKTLKAVAVQLDTGDLTPSLLGQFGLTFRNLQKRLEAGRNTDEPDALEALLTRGS